MKRDRRIRYTIEIRQKYENPSFQGENVSYRTVVSHESTGLPWLDTRYERIVSKATVKEGEAW